MRETFITFLVVAGLAGGYYYFKQHHGLSPHIGSPSQKASTSKNGLGHLSHRREDFTQGVNYDKASSKGNSGKDAAFPEGEGLSGEIAANENVYSIYQKQERPEVTQQTEEASMNPSKTVHGVPLQAWILSQKDNIYLPAVTANTGDGLRVYLQCLELKGKGTKYLDQKECKALLVRHSTDRGNPNY